MAEGPQTDLNTSNNKRWLTGKGASGASGAGSSLAEPQQHKQVAETTAQKEAQSQEKEGQGLSPTNLQNRLEKRKKLKYERTRKLLR